MKDTIEDIAIFTTLYPYYHQIFHFSIVGCCFLPDWNAVIGWNDVVTLANCVVDVYSKTKKKL